MGAARGCPTTRCRSRARSCADCPADSCCRRAASRTFSSRSRVWCDASGSDHYAEWIRSCKAGKKSITPVEYACGLTEFALLGALAERRYSTPGVRSGAGYGQNSRSDSAVVWIPASSDGHVHLPDAPPVASTAANAPRYWRTYNIMQWDANAMRFTNDNVANGYVDMPYRKEWDYKV